MKISVCIPQYNRIVFLLANLKHIEQQTYPNIELVISDDCSKDETATEILKIQQSYKYPIVFKRNEKNLGYDRNLRQSLELASGDYCFILGNDDSLNNPGDIEFLVNFLEKNDFPDIGFCNYVEDNDRTILYERATVTGLIGSGYQLALKHSGNFTFVAGLIYKRSSFLKFNTAKFDGSIFIQVYIACMMIASGCKLFSIKEPLVIKDIMAGEEHRNSYRDVIARRWKDYKVVDGGMPSIINVLISSFSEAGVLTQPVIYSIFLRIYGSSYPHWLLDYRSNKAFPEAIGLMVGLYPSKNKHYSKLSFFNKIRIYSRYLFSTLIGIITPVFIFRRLKSTLYKWRKK